MKGKKMELTKSQVRKARKRARINGQSFAGELELPNQPVAEFTETQRGYRAREKWARRYDELNGAPEGDWDR